MDNRTRLDADRWLFGFPRGRPVGPRLPRPRDVEHGLGASAGLPVLAHQEGAFLLRATPEQLRAYMQDPPKPPSLGGPAAMVLGMILAGTLLGGARPCRSTRPRSPPPRSLPPLARTPRPHEHSPQDPRGMACFPPGVSRQGRGEAKTCWGTLRAGQPLQHADLRVRGAGRSSVEHASVY